MEQQVDLTALALCKALRVERHMLRRWVEGLPVLAERPTKPRSARRFSMRDMAFLSAVHELETAYGVMLPAIARFSFSLHDALHGPRAHTRYFFIDMERASCEPLDEYTPLRPGIILDTLPVHRRVAEAFSIYSPYLELPFQPMSAYGGART